MRIMIVMVGIPASGKTTIATNLAHRLECMYPTKEHAPIAVLSLDAFRKIMCPSQLTTEHGACMLAGGRAMKTIQAAYDEAARRHIEAGSTMILDNTNVRHRHFDKTVRLARTRGYKILFAKISDADAPTPQFVDACVWRDRQRQGRDYVGHEVIEQMARHMTKLELRKDETVLLDPKWPPTDNAYVLCKHVQELLKVRHATPKRVLVVGDVHSRPDAIARIRDIVCEHDVDTVVFAGDLFDRGSAPTDTIHDLMDLENATTCHYVEGNHDSHLRAIAFDKDCSTKTFYDTQKTWHAICTAPDEHALRKWVHAYLHGLEPCVSLDFQTWSLVVSHGGIDPELALHVAETSTYPATVTANDFIYGLSSRKRAYQFGKPGDYTEQTITAARGIQGNDRIVRQAHGHRSTIRDGHHVTDTTPPTVWRLESQADSPDGCVSCLLASNDTQEVIEIR